MRHEAGFWADRVARWLEANVSRFTWANSLRIGKNRAEIDEKDTKAGRAPQTDVETTP